MAVSSTEPVASRIGPRDDQTRRLRIAMLSYNLPRPGYKRGGIERVAHELAEGMARRGHQLTVYSHDPAPPGASYTVAPLPWCRFVASWLGRRATMGYLGNVLMLLPDLDGADLVVAHGDSLLMTLQRTPVVRVMHGSAWDEARHATSPGRFLLQAGVYLQELASAALHRWTVGVSENTRRSNPCVRLVIPNGVNRQVFTPKPPERARRPTLLFVGAMSGRKRGAWMLEQFRSVIRPALPEAELHMVCAPGPGVDGVAYHEGVSDGELASLYRRAWLLVSPSTYEGFGLPYAESLSCGTPVLATSNPGSREVLASGGGVVCGDGTFAAEAVALLRDADRRDALAREGLVTARRYDLDHTVDAYHRLFQQVVRKSK